MAAFGAIQELIWLKGVLSEIGINLVDHIEHRCQECNYINEESYAQQTQQAHRYQVSLAERAHI